MCGLFRKYLSILRERERERERERKKEREREREGENVPEDINLN